MIPLLFILEPQISRMWHVHLTALYVVFSVITCLWSGGRCIGESSRFSENEPTHRPSSEYTSFVKLCKHGRFLLSIHDVDISKSMISRGEWEEDALQLFLLVVQPGDVVIDAGANIGAMTVPLAKRVGIHGVVHAFEPQRIIYQRLNANIALNDLYNVETYMVALGNVTGEIRIPHLNYSVDSNFGAISLASLPTTLAMGGSESEDVRKKQSVSTYTVPVITLDTTIFTKCPSFLKMDVEYMEINVLQGGKRLIANCRPIIYTENNCMKTSAALVEILYEMDYIPYWASESKLNMICIPKERSSLGGGDITMIGYVQVLREMPYLHQYFLEEAEEEEEEEEEDPQQRTEHEAQQVPSVLAPVPVPVPVHVPVAVDMSVAADSSAQKVRHRHRPTRVLRPKYRQYGNLTHCASPLDGVI